MGSDGSDPGMVSQVRFHDIWRQPTFNCAKWVLGSRLFSLFSPCVPIEDSQIGGLSQHGLELKTYTNLRDYVGLLFCAQLFHCLIKQIERMTIEKRKITI
jgi:hypothetical protein